MRVCLWRPPSEEFGEDPKAGCGLLVDLAMARKDRVAKNTLVLKGKNNNGGPLGLAV